MSESEKNFIEEFKRQVIYFAILGFLTMAGTSVSFYYNTQSNIDMLKTSSEVSLETQTTLIKKYEYLEREKIDKSDYVRELDEVKQAIRDLGTKIDNLR